MQAATFTVTKTVDTDDGVCNSDCSLREAVAEVNSNAGGTTLNRIEFSPFLNRGELKTKFQPFSA